MHIAIWFAFLSFVAMSPVGGSVSSPKEITRLMARNEAFKLSRLNISSIQESYISASSEVSLNTTKDVESKLLAFAAGLRAYVNQKHFDYLRFEAYKNELTDELSNLFIFVHHRLPYNHTLMKWLFHTQQMFEEMQHSARLIKHYKYLRSSSHKLVSKIIELNVWILALVDLDGNLDRLIDEHKEKIADAWEDMYSCEKQFARLARVTNPTREVFNAQLSRASLMIGVLLSQVKALG